MFAEPECWAKLDAIDRHMPPLPLDSLSEGALEARRKALRRGLARANTAAAVILLIVIGLALAAVWQAVKARRHADRADHNAMEAESATRRAEEELRKAQLAQARAARASGLMGRRAESLAALRAAAARQPSLELRNEAIATLALIDFQERWFQPGKANKVVPLTFDPTLEKYTADGPPGKILVRQVSDGAVVAMLSGPERRVSDAQFSPDGKFLVAQFVTGRWMMWNLAGGNVVIDLKFPPGALSRATSFSSVSSRLALTAPDGAVHVYERSAAGDAWRKVNQLNLTGRPRGFSLDPAGQHVAWAIRNDVEIRRMEDGSLAATMSFNKSVTEVAWHPEGRSCAVGLSNGDVLYWPIDSTNATRLTGHTGGITRLDFSHRGEWLLSTAEDGTTRLWAPVGRRSLLTSRRGLALGFSRDDREIAFVRTGEGFGIWRIEGGTEFRVATQPDSGETSTRTVDFDPDGIWLVATSPSYLTFWKATSAESPWLVSADDCRTAHFAADGKSVVTTSRRGVEVRSFQPATNGVGVEVGRPEPIWTGGPLQRASVTRGSREWLAVGGTRTLRIDLAAPGSPHLLPAEVARLQVAAVSPDGQRLAGSTGIRDATGLWNVETAREERALRVRGGLPCFSPSGDLLVVGAQQEFVAFDPGTGQRRWRLGRDMAASAGGAIAFARDGSLLALNVDRDLIRLVEPSSGAELATLTAPAPRNIASLAISRSGDFLAARAEGRDIQLWNLREIRRQLREIGLDFSAGDFAPGGAPGLAGPLTSGLTTPDPYWGIALPLGGAVLALGFGIYTFRYQRRLVRSYDELERLASERNRALRQAQADLLHSQKMKALGTLAAGIAHDFNNLLSVIRLSNDFLGRGVANDPDLAEESQAIEQAVQQGKNVVESMLGYSRSQTDQPEWLNVPDVVEETLGLLSQQFLSGTRLTMELNRDTAPVLLSRGRLVQILLNLIVNAAEAMPGAGQLTITVRTVTRPPSGGLVLPPREAPAYVELAVGDSGPGIPPEILPRIFEPFFTTKNVGASRGTGLGLSMIHTAAQTEGLGLSVETSMGVGTLFRVVIPAPARGANQSSQPNTPK